jgi:ribonuclease D
MDRKSWEAGPSDLVSPWYAAPMLPLIEDSGVVRDLAARIADSGRMAFDIEFVSEGRFVPELSIVQVAWGDEDAPEIALIDCLVADPGPILGLIASDAVETVAHAARQDLGLLSARFGLVARGFWDTQIAAAFAGLGEQIGYGKLVQALVGVELDKGAQYTAWLERPLSPAQHRYAADDVRYLPRVWGLLKGRLADLGRVDWVSEESDALARVAVPYGPAELAYLDVKGRGKLDRRGLARLQALAAWRQDCALAGNRPLSWILPDKALLELSRRGASSARDVRAAGVSGSVVQRHADDILGCLAEASHAVPPPLEPEGPVLEPRAQQRAAVVQAWVQARCEEIGIAARFVGTRADVEALVAWHAQGMEASAPGSAGVALLEGWRRALVGEQALAWLRGEVALVCSADRTDQAAGNEGGKGAGLQLVELGRTAVRASK